jgi:DNA repair exonuclease SbcCD nuclease subunit
VLKIINDTHIGAIRSGGTTLTSQWELRQSLGSKFKDLLPVGQDLMILGDLFDSTNVPIRDVLDTYFAIKAWSASSPNNKCWLVAGNHDLSKSSNVMASFDFLSALLADSCPAVISVKAPLMTPHGYIVPHLPSQALFDEALAAVPACEVLYLHCNYDNNFAAMSDQSLNLSKEAAAVLPVTSIVLGHEHKSKRVGKVFIPGNQIASSCSDWIGQRIKMQASVENGVVTLSPLPDTQEFAELDWQTLEITDHKFIRVVGNATSDQAAAVVTAISKLRQSSQAYVITNGVSIAAEDGTAAVFENALEGVQSFSVMAALRELMTEEEMNKLETLDA